MVYIIGIGHSIQVDKKIFWEQTEEFINEIKMLSNNFNIKFIAEEYSVECAKNSGISSTNTKDVADDLNIIHKYCDPDSKERKDIGWHSKKDDPIRLDNWFSKILDKINEPMIFVCGNQHTTDFKKIIEDNGFETEIIKKTFISKEDELVDKNS